MKEASITAAANNARLGPDFSDFEAALFNNPHYGYGGHKGMVLGVNNGAPYHWIFATYHGVSGGQHDLQHQHQHL